MKSFANMSISREMKQNHARLSWSVFIFSLHSSQSYCEKSVLLWLHRPFAWKEIVVTASGGRYSAAGSQSTAPISAKQARRELSQLDPGCPGAAVHASVPLISLLRCAGERYLQADAKCQSPDQQAARGLEIAGSNLAGGTRR
jgi:hypothetical protein